ncbi:MAG TPA: VOC family protein [Candidatus Acidoferrum sp.]|nr:VOC family protein [Candidatus Acidoferrum sp.]
MGKVVHFEIPADDLLRAKKFYSTVFGWSMNEMPEMEYVMVGTTESNENGMPREPGAINGGMLKRQDPVRNPVVTIDVESIDDTLASVEKNGGRVAREKLAVGDMGFTAYFRDSEGNVIGLWQNPSK